jgi:CrcB protein
MDTTLGRVALVAVGGGLGAVGRYGLDLAIRALWPALAGRFPLGILVVNALGCLAFGGIVGAAGGLDSMSPERRLFVLTGLLGGFTTFSTFGHDTARLLASGATGLALLNALGSLLLGVAAVFAGLWLGRLLAAG